MNITKPPSFFCLFLDIMTTIPTHAQLIHLTQHVYSDSSLIVLLIHYIKVESQVSEREDKPEVIRHQTSDETASGVSGVSDVSAANNKVIKTIAMPEEKIFS